MKLQQSGVKQIKIDYRQSKRQWQWNARDIVSKMYSTANWEEIPRDFEGNGLILPEGITAPILFKFAPLILTDFIIVSIQECHGSNDEAFINELELYNDCKLQLAL